MVRMLGKCGDAHGTLGVTILPQGGHPASAIPPSYLRHLLGSHRFNENRQDKGMLLRMHHQAKPDNHPAPQNGRLGLHGWCAIQPRPIAGEIYIHQTICYVVFLLGHKQEYRHRNRTLCHSVWRLGTESFNRLHESPARISEQRKDEIEKRHEEQKTRNTSSMDCFNPVMQQVVCLHNQHSHQKNLKIQVTMLSQV